MDVGYFRVSRSEQNPDLQKDALLKFGCRKVFGDIASGSVDDRLGLNEALDFVRAGDRLVVWRLDRLGRSILHLLQTINLLSEKQVAFCSLQENLDTTTSGGRLIFNVFGSIAQFEKDLIKERTLAGLRAARERGRIGGRPKKLSSADVEIAKRLLSDRAVPVANICSRLQVSKSTLYRTIAGPPAAKQ